MVTVIVEIATIARVRVMEIAFVDPVIIVRAWVTMVDVIVNLPLIVMQMGIMVTHYVQIVKNVVVTKIMDFVVVIIQQNVCQKDKMDKYVPCLRLLQIPQIQVLSIKQFLILIGMVESSTTLMDHVLYQSHLRIHLMAQLRGLLGQQVLRSQVV